MRRALHALIGEREWFLRSRGDAPDFVAAFVQEHMVPPLARRCAAKSFFLEAYWRGSSARAEMRRHRTGSESRPRGFLRSRGDAPFLIDNIIYSYEVPPLARRCAIDIDASSGHMRGSSARAEMRHIPAIRRALSGRFLRSRGDAPCTIKDTTADAGVPPLARRCAFFHRLDLYRLGGSSARAEMRPVLSRTRTAVCRFLRSRGDAPP